MSGELQRRKNAELALKRLEVERGGNVEVVTIHLHDFTGRNEPPPPPVLTEDGHLIKIVLHKYPPEPTEEEEEAVNG